jgi:VanZ family protein
MPPARRTLLFRIALVLALLGIGYLAITPTQAVLPESNDKLNHLGAFLVLALLGDHAFPGRPWDWRKFLPLLGYGLLLECIQYFVPNRYFSLWDLAADALGLALYPLAMGLLLRLSAKRRGRT